MISHNIVLNMTCSYVGITNRCLLVQYVVEYPTDINECSSNSCSNNGTCSDLINGYRCSCAAGFTGINCQTSIPVHVMFIQSTVSEDIDVRNLLLSCMLRATAITETA